MIRNNTFTDWKYALDVQPDAGPSFCEVRNMDNVVFDRNTVRNTWTSWLYGDIAVQIHAGPGLATTVNNVTISNNTFTSPTWDACIWSNAGNSEAANPGTMRIVGNTCAMDIRRWGAFAIGPLDASESPTFPQQNYVIQDNVITGLASGDLNIWFHYAPTHLALGGNVYSPNGNFVWNLGGATNFTAWKTSSGEATAKQCNPTFVSLATGDLHLAPTDTCAHGAGVDISASTNHDVDGQTRPQNAWDAGADEIP